MRTHNCLSCHSHRGDGIPGFCSDFATSFSSTKTITKWSDRLSEFSFVVRLPTTSIANNNKFKRYFHRRAFLPDKLAKFNTGLSLAMLWRVVEITAGLPRVDKTSLTLIVTSHMDSAPYWFLLVSWNRQCNATVGSRNLFL